MPKKAEVRAALARARKARDEQDRSHGVFIYEQVGKIQLHSFVFDYSKLEGSFRVRFDRVECPHAFGFGYTNSGKCAVAIPTGPVRHTDIIELVRIPEASMDAIRKAIRLLVPDIKPSGYDEATGAELPIEKRIPSAEYIQRIRATIGKPGFQHAVQVEAPGK